MMSDSSYTPPLSFEDPKKEDEDDSSYSPPLGIPQQSIELFPGVSIGLPVSADKETNNRPEDGKSHDNNPQDNEVGSPTNEPIKSQTPNDKDVSIRGTNIVLESDEDIKAWIAERRKNWPTARRIEQRKKQKAEADEILGKLGVFRSKGGNNKQRRVCKRWQATGHCKNGKRCRFLHERSKSNIRRLPNNNIKVIHGIPVQIPKRFTPMVNGGKSLSSLLVESEHLKDENLTLLDVFDRLVESGVVHPHWDDLKATLHLDKHLS